MKTTTPPRWDLTTIFSSLDGRDYEDACQKCSTDIAFLASHATEVSSFINTEDATKWLEKYFATANDCASLLGSLSSYTYCIYSTDTNNTQAINALNAVEEIGIQFEQIQLAFREVLAKNVEIIKQVCNESEKFKNYAYILDEEVFFQTKQMTPELEKLAADMSRTGGGAWSRLQQQIISNLVHPKSGKTFNEIRNDAYSAKDDERKIAYEHEIELLKSVEIPIAAALNCIKGETITLNKRVNWETGLEKSCRQSRVSKKTLDALIGAIEDSLPLWREYLQVKAQLLNKEKLDFCDLFAPLAENPQTDSVSPSSSSAVSRVWSYDDAKAYIIEKFSSFSNELGDFAKYAFDNNWIDAEIRKGKTGGAYCTDFPYHKQTRVLSNFSGSFSDITTLAHELGHAYHQYCVQDLDNALIHYPMTLAETASNFCETIIQKDVMQNATGFDKVSMTEMRLQDSCQVLVDILSRFYFERSVFEKREEGELSASDFCALMLDAQEKTYGSGLNQKHEYMWAVKGHYYSPELDFYNFPYAFGLLFSAGLYSRYLQEGSRFAQTYKSLLEDTGRLSCEEVCKKAGFDIETREFWKSGIDLFKADLDVLKEYAQR